MKLLFIGARLFDDVAVYTKKMGITTVLTESNPQAQNLDLADSYHLVPRGMEHPKDIALKENEVVGVLLLKKSGEKNIKMRQVAVATNCQYSGIGKLLVFFSEQYAKNNGFYLIELHACDTAKDFYLKLNYKVEGNEFMEVGIPHYKMKKVLV